MARLKYPIESSNYKATVFFQPIAITSTLDRLGSNGDFRFGETFQDQNGRLYGRNTGTGVELLLPQGFQVSDGVDIQNVNLEFLGQASLNALSSMNETSSALMAAGKMAVEGAKGLGEQISSITDLFKATQGQIAQPITKALAARAVSKFGENLVTNSITSATRTVSNPNTRALFRAVNMRQFIFNFTMQPTSASEASVIEQIINNFRKELYPDTIDGNSGVPLAYEFPNLFKIVFRYDGREMGNVPKLLPCYLRSVSTNFNPNSMAFHPGGRFTETQLSLTFDEYRTLDKKDITGELRSFSGDFDTLAESLDVQTTNTGFNPGPDDGLRG